VSSDDSPISGVSVKGAYSAGLAAEKNAIYTKDSVDFIVTVTDTMSTEGAGQPDDSDDVKVWGFEAKGG
jgi:hypothetical protein